MINRRLTLYLGIEWIIRSGVNGGRRMRIGEVATRAGVSVQAVRLYERLGILKRVARLRSGYRDYSLDTIALIRFIKWAQQYGFTLGEIKSLIDLREAERSKTEQARRLAEAKIAALDRQIKQ